MPQSVPAHLQTEAFQDHRVGGLEQFCGAVAVEHHSLAAVRNGEVGGPLRSLQSDDGHPACGDFDVQVRQKLLLGSRVQPAHLVPPRFPHLVEVAVTLLQRDPVVRSRTPRLRGVESSEQTAQQRLQGAPRVPQLPKGQNADPRSGAAAEVALGRARVQRRHARFGFFGNGLQERVNVFQNFHVGHVARGLRLPVSEKHQRGGRFHARVTGPECRVRFPVNGFDKANVRTRHAAHVPQRQRAPACVL